MKERSRESSISVPVSSFRRLARATVAYVWPGARLERQRFHDATERLIVLEREQVASHAFDETLERSLTDANDKLDNILERQREFTSTHDSRLDRLRDAVTKVEPYQPLYGVAGIITAPARISLDRAQAIAKALSPVRGLRVLDIGSSLGFMSFYLTDRGADVTGWEYNVENNEVARLVGELNGHEVRFVNKVFNLESADQIRPGHFDAALILAVLHHVTHFDGLEASQQMMKSMMSAVPVVIVELAAKGEDPALFWNDAQPADPLAVLDLVRDDVDIVHLGDFGTHLSDQTRPLYRISWKKIVEVNGRPYPYKRVAHVAYEDSPIAGDSHRRRYYFHPSYIVKEYWFTDDAPDNWRQIVSELFIYGFLDGAGPVHHAQRLLDAEFNHEYARLVIEALPGQLLSDSLPLAGTRVVGITRDILMTLRDLTTHGLNHNDVRSWNIVVDGSSAWLIDYGRVSAGPDGHDDVVALAHVMVAAVTGVRDAPFTLFTHLPDLAPLAGTGLAAFAAALAEGVRDCDSLLMTLPPD